MNAGEIVVHHVERNGGGMILDFFRESIRKPGEAPHPHPHREILTFNVAGVDMIRVRLTDDRVALAGNAFWRAVAALAVSVALFVNLHQLSVVYAFAKDLDDGGKVCPQSVRAKLNAIRQTTSQIRHEHFSGFWITLPEGPAWDQLCIGVNRRPGPNVARNPFLGNILREVPLFAVAESPYLIDLDAPTGKLAERGMLKTGADRAQLHQ